MAVLQVFWIGASARSNQGRKMPRTFLVLMEAVEGKFGGMKSEESGSRESGCAITL